MAIVSKTKATLRIIGDDLVKDLKSKGFQFDQESEDMRYLWREAVLHDPSGNKIKLYWADENRLNPPWRVELSA